jgi:mRNA-degrading endonuclease RelE of RelBE toxin-antitoxin system
MLNVEYRDDFLRKVGKIKNTDLKDKVKKQIEKILNNPEVGKPMRYGRKDTRELYVSPYRLAYAYIQQENKVIFLELYHKDEQ